MCYKYIVLTDTHLGWNNNNNFWLDLTEKLFDEIISIYSPMECHGIIHLGDWYHDRKLLDIKTYNKSLDIIQKLKDNDIPIYIILGNHDMYYKSDMFPHSLRSLKLFNNVEIIDKIYHIGNDIVLSPWNTIPEVNNDKTYLFSHLEINEFPMNYTNRTFEGGRINVSDFKHFKQVYSGHFHTPSKIKNVQYIGSAFPMTFNDLNSKRGYYIFDSKGKMEFFKFTSAPKFIRLTSNDEIKEEDIKDNIVEFIFLEDFGSVKNDKLVQTLESYNPHKLKINYKIQLDEEDLIVDENEEFKMNDNREVIREYIDKKLLPKHINKETLKKFVEKLEKEK